MGVFSQSVAPESERVAGDCIPSESTSIGSEKSLLSVETQLIKWVENFDEMYVLGDEVMTSGHDFMKLRFARRKCDGVEVVVKLQYKPQCFKSKEAEKQWRQCTEYLLNMPESAGIAKLHEVLEDGQTFYIVMEKVDGMDLHQILDEGLVTLEIAREALFQLLNAMAHLHAHNAVHKDLKLENVMIGASPRNSKRSPRQSKSFDSLSRSLSERSNGSSTSSLNSSHSVKVIDFDTLQLWEPSSSPAKRGTAVVGTNQYIAQEAYAGKYSPASDIFAVGVIAYMLLTSTPPFPDTMFDDEAGENWVGSPKMHRIRLRLKKASVSFSHPVFQEHPEAKDLIKRMLSFNEEDRPTANDALEHPFLEGLTSANDDLFDDIVQETIVEDAQVVVARQPFSFWCSCQTVEDGAQRVMRVTI